MLDIPESPPLAKMKKREQGEAFQSWLLEHQYTPTEFADRVGVYVRRVRSWMHGERRLPILLPALLELLAKEKK